MPQDTLHFDDASSPTKEPDGGVDLTEKLSADKAPVEKAQGASSLGASPGFAGSTEADVVAAVAAAPKPEGEVRKSWSESGDYKK